MPLYWILMFLAIVVALNADKIDKAVNADGKIKKYMAIIFAVMIVVITVLIKTAINKV